MFELLWPDATPDEYKAVEALKLIKFKDMHKMIAGGVVDTVGELKNALTQSSLLGALTGS